MYSGKKLQKLPRPTQKKKVQSIQCTEHIAWLCGDTEFLLECWKNISQVSVLFFQFFLLCFQCVSQSHKFGTPTSFDLTIFMRLIVLKYRIFCPISSKMQDEGFRFFMLSPAKMGYFFFNSLFFRWSKHNYISSWGYDECLNSVVYSIEAFLFHHFR